MSLSYEQLSENALADCPPTHSDALEILDSKDVELLPLVHAAYRPRYAHFGRKVKVHMLNNVQCGLCPEDCGYCGQSKVTEAPIKTYRLKSDKEILEGARAAHKNGAFRYCIVLSGRGPSMERVRHMAGLVRRIKEEVPVQVCLSTGLINLQMAQTLKEAGLDRLNHNLNTSEEHYPEICTTHTYAERVSTLEAAKEVGLSLCSGLIAGMGEGSEDLVDVAFALRRLTVPSIPVNFLVPIEGNPVYHDGSLTPDRCLRILCMVRLVNPTAEIRIAAGREGHLRSLQALALYPANSLFVQGYLLTRGSEVAETYRMIRDAGFEVESSAQILSELESESASDVSTFRIGGDVEVLQAGMKVQKNGSDSIC